jgi:hypothetical protein
LPISKEDLGALTDASSWRRHYILGKKEHREIIDVVIYDKFLISLRNACMSENEVREIKKDCEFDPHFIEPTEGDEIEFDSYKELLNICKKRGMSYGEAKTFSFKGFGAIGVPFKGGKLKFCCNKVIQ